MTHTFPQKEIIFRNPLASHDVRGSAFVAVDAELGAQIQGGDFPLYRSYAWRQTGFRSPRHASFELADELESLEPWPVANETEARCLVLVGALSNVHRQFYNHVSDFAPFAQWRLAIGCADESSLEHLSKIVNEPVEEVDSTRGLNRVTAEARLTSALQSFAEVSTILLPKVLAEETWRGTPLDVAAIRELRL